MRPAAGGHSMRSDMWKPPVTDDPKRIMVISSDGRQSGKVASIRSAHLEEHGRLADAPGGARRVIRDPAGLATPAQTKRAGHRARLARELPPSAAARAA